jgi:EpsI family protein
VGLSVLLRLGLLGGVLAAVYAGVLRDLASVWWTRDDYSHGFLVLPIAAYLVWARRSVLRELPLRPERVRGLALVLGAAALLVFGTAGRAISLSGVSLVVMAAGLVLMVLGPRYLRAFAFPIAYLLFMVPVFDELLVLLQWPLQLATARVTVGFLQTLGISALLDQNYVVLAGKTLEVASACSGTTYLISIMAIGLPLAYLALSTWWARLVLALWALAIGVMANWVRVILIAIWASRGGDVLHGPFEIFRAMFVSWVGIAALAAAAWALAKLQAPAQEEGPAPTATPRGVAHPAGPIASHRAWQIALALLVLLGAYSRLLDRGPVDLKEDFTAFPASFEGWRGRRADAREAVFRVDGADQELVRIYEGSGKGALQLYVAYLASQQHGKKIADYRTAQLHEGTEVAEIPLQPGHTVKVNRGRLRGPGGDHPIVFWYDLDGRVISNRYEARLETVRSSLVHGRTNGALVLIATSPDDREAARQLEGFARDLMPRLRTYFP